MVADNSFVSTLIKLFFLLTPFFVLSMFVTLTHGMTPAQRNGVALKTTLSNFLVCLCLYFFGDILFSFLGITLNAFSIGAGAILFINAVEMVTGRSKTVPGQNEGDIAVVPLSIPFAIGPGTTGAMLVMGATAGTMSHKIIDSCGILVAVCLTGSILLAANPILRIIGEKGLNILSKLTGLVVAALAAQMIFTGIRNFLSVGN